MTTTSPRRSPDRRIALAAYAGVGLAHLVAFALLGRMQPPPRPYAPPQALYVELTPPAPRPPPPAPPPAQPAAKAGGGAPAAASRMHVPPIVRPVPPELPAPPVQAAEPALVVGVAPTPGPAPATGQGGEGTGAGQGAGAGVGPGAGSTRARFLRGPTRREIAREFPRGARVARIRTGQVLLRCRIRLDTRVEGCAVVSETPPDVGFGAAALRVASNFRFQPPTAGDRALDGEPITLGVDFAP